MSQVELCPQCGTPVAQSIRGSLDTFVLGYVLCWKCRMRINLEESGEAGRAEGGKQMDQSEKEK